MSVRLQGHAFPGSSSSSSTNFSNENLTIVMTLAIAYAVLVATFTREAGEIDLHLACVSVA